MVMRKHQRYFPLFDSASGALLPYFITVANGPIDPAAVAAGNEAVLRARFEDATFFYSEDLKQPLEDFRCGHACAHWRAHMLPGIGHRATRHGACRAVAANHQTAQLMAGTGVRIRCHAWQWGAARGMCMCTMSGRR